MDNRYSESKALLESMPGLGPSTAYGQLVTHLADTLRKNQADPLLCESLRPIILAEKPHQGEVFLSVVMRTQGRRPAALKEALDCLAKQSDQDFEVLLIGHRLTADEADIVRQTLDALPSGFRPKVRYLTLERPGRSAPLNFGFAHARGSHIAVLDDDDLVTDAWVAEFHQAAAKAPGTILHAYGLAQQWAIEETGEVQTTKPVGDYIRIYCRDYNAAYQLYMNNCPLISLAFPREIFADWGFIFDEALTTTEDWDYLMRTAPLFGVTDIPVPTSIYRLWTNAENSTTVHAKDEWEQNRSVIRARLASAPSVIDANGMADLVRLLSTGVFALDDAGQLISVSDRELHDIRQSNTWKLGLILTFFPRKLTSFRIEAREKGLKSGLSWLLKHWRDSVFR